VQDRAAMNVAECDSAIWGAASRPAGVPASESDVRVDPLRGRATAAAA
jgi:hypothetical protein